LLEGRVVVRIEGIESHHPLAALEQRFSDGGADEAGGASEEGSGVCRTRHRDGRRAGQQGDSTNERTNPIDPI
jgi:hypothetical protein